MSLPFVDLKSQYTRLKADIDRRIQAVLDHGGYVLGPEVTELEKKLSAFAGCADVVSCASGTDALLMALMLENIGRGDAVFLPSFTFTATAEVVLLLGATPVFVDVDPFTFNIDFAHLAHLIAETERAGKVRPRIIMPVDLFGLPVDYTALNALAEKHGLKVIADAAQSFGGALGNKKVGNLAPITATSFYPAKPLGCYGDGGAIFIQDPSKGEVLRSIRVHGQGAQRYDVVRIGVNGRLDTIQAAVLLAKLEVFDDELRAREHLASRYDAQLPKSVTTPRRVAGAQSAWAQYSILCSRRDELQSKLKAQGVPTAIYYPLPMHLQPAYIEHGKGKGSLPVSERLSKEILALPMHPYLSDENFEKVCASVEAAFAA